jgi:hypothetical protein
MLTFLDFVKKVFSKFHVCFWHFKFLYHNFHLDNKFMKITNYILVCCQLGLMTTFVFLVESGLLVSIFEAHQKYI